MHWRGVVDLNAGLTRSTSQLGYSANMAGLDWLRFGLCGNSVTSSATGEGSAVDTERPPHVGAARIATSILAMSSSPADVQHSADPKTLRHCSARSHTHISGSAQPGGAGLVFFCPGGRGLVRRRFAIDSCALVACLLVPKSGAAQILLLRCRRSCVRKRLCILRSWC